MSSETCEILLTSLTVDMSSHLLQKASPLRRPRTQRTLRLECQLRRRTCSRNLGVDCIDICAVCVPYCEDVVIPQDHYELSSKIYDHVQFNIITRTHDHIH